jgi:NTE family protein
MRKLNLVFQGGGVKGIAYAGVLQSLSLCTECRVVGVGGTSAGALVAALVAIGKRGDELQQILKDPELFTLLESADVERYSRLKDLVIAHKREWKDAFNDLNKIWDEYNRSGLPLMKQIRLISKLRTFQQKHKEFISQLPVIWQDVKHCWDKKGLHSSQRLREWLNKVLEGKKFADIADVDLRIVATDVKNHSYSIFISAEHQGESIAHAVHASVSIPLFFEPLASGTEYLVDGGVLSNFPKFLFAQSPYPTVGFQLTENIKTADCTTTLGYLTHLLGTMVAAHDKHRKAPPHFRSYAIETPDYIPFDKFNLDTRDINELFYRGMAKGNSINWLDSKHSSEEELVVYYDPRPDDVLHQALVQANLLVGEHLEAHNWVEELQHKTVVRVRIEDDWSARYDRLDEMRVVGPHPLFLQRLIVKVPPAVGRLKSLADTEPKCFEEVSGGRKPLPFIPVFNREDGKGFAIFYSPPIQDGQPPRKIRASMRIAEEFAPVAKGEKRDVSMKMTRRAKNHRITLSMEILVHRSLPELEFTPSFDGLYTNGVEVINGRKYERHAWTFPETRCEEMPFPLMVEFRLAGSQETHGRDD